MASQPLPDKTNNTARHRSVHLPGLNGLRAIAALAVVVSHTTYTLAQFGLNSNIFGTRYDNPIGLDLATDGVTIFFVLSGFLITYLLLKEKEANSSINVRNFYVRRVLRIWPLYYLYFAVSITIAMIFGIAYDKSMLPFYILLAANIPQILGKTAPFIFHYWSLGVEEQFYLFFPQLARLSNKKLLRNSIILLTALFSLKGFFWVLHRLYQIELPLQSIITTSFDTMFIGVIAGILYFQQNSKFLKYTTNRLVQLISWACVVLMAINKFPIASTVDQDIVAVIAVCLITGQVTRKNLFINLENKVCDFVGKISYGIYVIHPVLLFFMVKIIGKLSTNSVFAYIGIYLLIITITIAIAFLSYEFMEKKFLRLKEKYSTIVSADTKEVFDEVLSPNLAAIKVPVK